MGTAAKKSKNKKERSAFMKWLLEDDAPEIGFATKEPLRDYLRGVRSEFHKIQWPSKEQVKNEFVTVIVIVAIISAIVYFIDIALNKFMLGMRGF